MAYGLAQELGGVPGARVLRSDVIRKRLCGVALTDRLPSSAYGKEMGERVFRRFARRPRRRSPPDALSSLTPSMRGGGTERYRAVADNARVPFVGLWLEAPPEALAARIAARREDASDATPAVLQQQLAYSLGHMAWHRIDAGGPVDIVVEAARQALAHAASEPAATGDQR